MGLDIYCVWIAGVRLTRRGVKENITKYNPDTGAPYKVATERSIWLLDDGTTAVDIDKLDDDTRAEFFHAPVGADWDGAVAFLGLEGELIGSHRGGGDNYAPFPSEGECQRALNTVRKLLASYAIKQEPQLWFVRHDSY